MGHSDGKNTPFYGSWKFIPIFIITSQCTLFWVRMNPFQTHTMFFQELFPYKVLLLSNDTSSKILDLGKHKYINVYIH